MKGRDLILYILSNGLENEEIFKNGNLLGFIRPSEAAVKYNVGVETIYAHMHLGTIDYVVIGGEIFIPADFKLKNK